MVALIVSLKVQPGKAGELEEAFRVATAAVIANEPGCSCYRLVRSRTEADSYKVLEVYRDQAALDAHTQSAHFGVLRDALKQMIASPPAAESFDTPD